MRLSAALFATGNAERRGLLGRLINGSLVAAKIPILARFLGIIGKVGSCNIGRITGLLLFGITPPPPCILATGGKGRLALAGGLLGHCSMSLQLLFDCTKALTDSF